MTASASHLSLVRAVDFQAVFRAELGFVCNLLLRLGVRQADVEDAAHDVFVAFHRRLDAFDPSRPVRAWLAGIAVRVASDHRRRAHHRREVHKEQHDVADPAPRADDAIEQEELRAQVIAALEHVRDERRPVLVLHDVEGMSAPEIATILGIPLNTVYSRLRLARADLRDALSRAKGRQR